MLVKLPLSVKEETEREPINLSAGTGHRSGEKKEENDRSAPLGPQEPDPPQGNTLGGGYVSMTSVANRSLIFCAFPQLRPFLERF